VAVQHNHGTGCTFASGAAAAMALGFVAADACVLAKMLTTQALLQGYAAGAGPGPVQALSGFSVVADALPALSWDEQVQAPVPWMGSRLQPTELGLYAIADHYDHLQALLDAGVRTVQLRTKVNLQQPQAVTHLRDQIQRSVAACRAVGAQLFINDHWKLALDAQAPGVHLGQEDLLALTLSERAELMSRVEHGLALGVSTHSLWELCRTRTLQPRYVACGPVWPTLTKAMPWQPQGLHNLRWWARMAGVPVVAIGGILQPEQVQQAAATGVGGVCVVRGLSEVNAQRVRLFSHALQKGQKQALAGVNVPPLPHPSL
jgi:hydroxymethylpyrimidine kinase/phosphomethylpyrimidine kinase/thiamine-phosphate diphosphorylase